MCERSTFSKHLVDLDAARVQVLFPGMKHRPLWCARRSSGTNRTSVPVYCPIVPLGASYRRLGGLEEVLFKP